MNPATNPKPIKTKEGSVINTSNIPESDTDLPLTEEQDVDQEEKEEATLAQDTTDPKYGMDGNPESYFVTNPGILQYWTAEFKGGSY